VRASTAVFDSIESAARAGLTHDGFFYSRWSNPTVDAVEHSIASLEGGERAVLFSSGMAAIAGSLIATLPRGGMVIAQEEVYGGTDELLRHELPRLGFEVVRAPVGDLCDTVQRHADTLSAVYCETPTNPTLRIVDLRRVREAMGSRAEGHRAGASTLIVDATLATPINLRPLEHGAHLSLHSATKYLGGHHDLLAGVVSGDAARMAALWRHRKLHGAVLDPEAASLLARGLDTLALRVRAQNADTTRIVHALSSRTRSVRRVHHPALPSHPDHALANATMRGFGGLFAVELEGDRASTFRFVDRLTRFAKAVSLGGVHAIVSLPSVSSHVGLPPDARARLGITDTLVRFSVGVEGAEPLLVDLGAALDALEAELSTSPHREAT